MESSSELEALAIHGILVAGVACRSASMVHLVGRHLANGNAVSEHPVDLFEAATLELGNPDVAEDDGKDGDGAVCIASGVSAIGSERNGREAPSEALRSERRDRTHKRSQPCHRGFRTRHSACRG